MPWFLRKVPSPSLLGNLYTEAQLRSLFDELVQQLKAQGWISPSASGTFTASHGGYRFLSFPTTAPQQGVWRLDLLLGQSVTSPHPIMAGFGLVNTGSTSPYAAASLAVGLSSSHTINNLTFWLDEAAHQLVLGSINSSSFTAAGNTLFLHFNPQNPVMALDGGVRIFRAITSTLSSFNGSSWALGVRGDGTQLQQTLAGGLVIPALGLNGNNIGYQDHEPGYTLILRKGGSLIYPGYQEAVPLSQKLGFLYKPTSALSGSLTQYGMEVLSDSQTTGLIVVGELA